MPARYALQNHPAFSDPLTKEDLYILVSRGSLARGEMVECEETGAMHTVGEVISGMRPPRASAVARPAFREIKPDFEAPQEAGEEDEEAEENEDDEQAYTAGGEPLLHRSHPSWLTYSKTLFLALLLAIAAGLLFMIDPAWALLAAVLSLMVLFGVFVSRATHEYIVTPQRVELIWGVIGRSSKEARICDIRSIDVHESGLKGLLGLGTIDFSTAANAGVEVQFRDVRRAHEVKELVRQLQNGIDPTED
jgi:membrane protein YdbS with pleckstrin-like domain